LILAVLQFFLRSGVSFGGGAAAALRVQLNSSGLLPWFNYALQQIYWSVSIWVPGGVPSLFANLLGQS